MLRRWRALAGADADCSGRPDIRGPVMANTTPPNITMKPTTLRIGKLPTIVALKRDAGNQHAETDDEQRRALQPPPRGRCAQPSATDTGGEFGVLGIESALDLVEHPLLMIGEWHSSLLADKFDT